MGVKEKGCLSRPPEISLNIALTSQPEAHWINTNHHYTEYGHRDDRNRRVKFTGFDKMIMTLHYF